jgi:hypothetical protein
MMPSVPEQKITTTTQKRKRTLLTKSIDFAGFDPLETRGIIVLVVGRPG